MHDFQSIFILSIAMFIICFFCGSIPLYINISKKRFNHLLLFGAGGIIGTALAIIIPEGIATLYSTQNKKSNYIATSLICGFLFMLIIDLFTVYLKKNSKLIYGDKLNKFSTTLGLISHSAADGLALGAAAGADNGIETMVFLAILLHKGPSSFTLTTFLLQSGIARKSIRKHLLAFSLSAPISSLLTFFMINSHHHFLNSTLLVNVNGSYAVNTNHEKTHYHSDLTIVSSAWTLIFSGATFLYVACFHVLPETNFFKIMAILDNHKIRENSAHDIVSASTNSINIENDDKRIPNNNMIGSSKKALSLKYPMTHVFNRIVLCYLFFIAGIMFPFILAQLPMHH